MLILFIVLGIIVLLLAAFYIAALPIWVKKEIKKIPIDELPEDVRQLLDKSMKRAWLNSFLDIPIALFSMVFMPFLLLFTKREANKLPILNWLFGSNVEYELLDGYTLTGLNGDSVDCTVDGGDFSWRRAELKITGGAEEYDKFLWRFKGDEHWLFNKSKDTLQWILNKQPNEEGIYEIGIPCPIPLEKNELSIGLCYWMGREKNTKWDGRDWWARVRWFWRNPAPRTCCQLLGANRQRKEPIKTYGLVETDKLYGWQVAVQGDYAGFVIHRPWFWKFIIKRFYGYKILVDVNKPKMSSTAIGFLFKRDEDRVWPK